MITPEVTVSFVNVFNSRPTPSGDRNSYTLCAMLPKTDTKGKALIDDAIKQAIQLGVDKGKFPKTAVASLKLPLRDGDKEHETGARGAEFKGMWFWNCARYEEQGAPSVVKPQSGAIVPVIDQSEVYSGMIARLDVNFYPFNAKANKGIACGLNSVLKVKDGQRLDGRSDPTDAFSGYADLPEPSAVKQNVEDDIPF